MRFYQRTYLLIILVILSSTLFSSILLRDIFLRTEQREIESQLKRETDTVSRNLHRKTQQFWLQLIKLVHDEYLISEVEKGSFTSQDVVSRIVSHIRPYGADLILLRYQEETIVHRLSLHDPDLKLYQVKRTRWHPAVRYQLVNGSLYTIGTMVIPTNQEDQIDVFIIKEIDALYCESLTYGTTSDILLTHSGGTIIGTTPVQSSPYHLPGITPVSSTDQTSLIYDTEFNGQRYHMAFKKIGELADSGDSLITAILYRSTTLEQMNIELQARMLLNLLAGALLASVITIFISRMVTRPMNTLLTAMGKIETGKYSVRLPVSKQENREVQELYDGFNAMAQQLTDDQIQQKRFIKEITVLKDFNEQILQSLESGVAAVTEGHIIDKHNKPFGSIFGCKRDLTGTSLSAVNSTCFSPKVLHRIDEIIAGNRRSYKQIRRVRNERVLQLSCTFLSHSENRTDEPRCLVVVEDVTDKTKLEERMFQAERMNALSVLSSGVAHEINNPLSSVLSNVQGLTDIEADEQKRKSLHWIEQDTRRIAYIIKDMLDFSSSHTEYEQSGDVEKAAAEVLKYVERMKDAKQKHIQFSVDIPSNLPRVILGQHALQQVIFNLVQNALHALNKYGTLYVGAWMEISSQKEKFVHVLIRDNGIGMSEDVIQRIFDPFYTTKHDGTGTGLGLSVVYGLMKRCGGEITVASREGEGAEFTLKFPLSEEDEIREEDYGEHR